MTELENQRIRYILERDGLMPAAPKRETPKILIFGCIVTLVAFQFFNPGCAYLA